MTPLKFSFETGKIIIDNQKLLIECYNKYPKESISAVLLLFKKHTMQYFYISETHNKILLDKLEPFMIERLKLNHDKLSIISIGAKGLVSCHYFSN